MNRIGKLGWALALLLSACDGEAERGDVDDDGAGGKADDTADGTGIDTKGFRFVLDDGAFVVRRDHAGAPLLATIWGRLADYNVDAPFVELHGQGAKPWLLHITDMFHMIHKSWAPSFEAMGLDACDDLGVNDDLFEALGNGEIDFDALKPEQCFGQRMLWPDPERDGKRVKYRRTIAVSLPDYLTIELDRAAAFPNGRVLHEQINSLMFAMAFLDQGGDCTDDDGRAVTCDLHTLWRRSDFLAPFNDVPFRGTDVIGEPAREFPYLADPHGM